MSILQDGVHKLLSLMTVNDLTCTNVLTPDAVLQEEEAEFGVRRGRVNAQTRADEEEYVEYSPAKKTKAAEGGKARGRQEGRPAGGKGAQKEGGPCVICYCTSKLAHPTWPRC